MHEGGLDELTILKPLFLDRLPKLHVIIDDKPICVANTVVRHRFPPGDLIEIILGGIP